MNHSMLIPVEALAHLQCSACKKYLSYFPIYMNQNSLLPICGRCSKLLIPTESYIRNKTYESVAQMLKFPCIYYTEGCVEYLTPYDIPKHEKNCSYGLISCALDCVWQGKITQVIDHIEAAHPDTLIRNGEFEIDIFNSYETHSFLVHNDELFAMKRKIDDTDKTLQCSLFCYKTIESLTNYHYEMTMFNGCRNLSVKFPTKSADNFQEENITEIKVEDIKKMLDDPSMVIGSIKIFTADEQKSEEPKKPNPAINMEMLDELECPVCFEYIVPPIYQCITGHSLCGDCKNKVSECPTCTSEINTAQNITLEKISLHLTYPCKYLEYGCEFVSKASEIKQHQKHCLIGPQLCPLKDYEGCNWKGTAKDMYPHVTNNHYENILEIDNICIFIDGNYFEAEDSQCYIKKISNVIFRVHYRYAEDYFFWAVQLVGPPEEARNYKFEIDIQDGSNNNQKVFLRSLCTHFKDKEEAFSVPGQYVFLMREQINSFITDQLSYTIRIRK